MRRKKIINAVLFSCSADCKINNWREQWSKDNEKNIHRFRCFDGFKTIVYTLKTKKLIISLDTTAPFPVRFEGKVVAIAFQMFPSIKILYAMLIC